MMHTICALVTGVQTCALPILVEKSRKIASALLECDVADVEISHGRLVVVGTDRSVSFQEVSHAAYFGWGQDSAVEYGLEEQVFFDPEGRNTPSAVHLCVVMVDADTGHVRVREFYAVDDAGRIINPMVVKGQVHGAIARGIGQALFENCTYDPESGQLLAGSYMDYAMPRADVLPSFTLDFPETPAKIGSASCR